LWIVRFAIQRRYELVDNVINHSEKGLLHEVNVDVVQNDIHEQIFLANIGIVEYPDTDLHKVVLQSVFQ
jgi:hypothetical protein